MPKNVIRFAVGTPTLHSVSWKVTVAETTTGPAVTVVPREISNDYHISLHPTGEYHARIGKAERKSLGYGDGELMGPKWSRPEPVGSGFTYAFRIIVHRGAISRTHAIAKSSKCVLIPPPSEGMAVEVSFWFAPTAPGDTSWVGSRAMNTRVVGFLPAGEEFLTVVWREDVAGEGSLKLPLAAVKPLVRQVEGEGGLAMMMWQLDDAGVPLLRLGRFDDHSAVKFRAKFNELHGETGGAS